MSSKFRDLMKMAAIIAVTFGAGLTIAQAFNIPRAGQAQARTEMRPASNQPGSARAVSAPGAVPGFADVVDRVNPSIVFIQVTTRPSAQQNDRNVPPELQDFFRRYQQQPQQPRLRRGSGTGFITSRDGYILTNNHVVEDAQNVTVRLLDNREFTARVIGRDPNTDVAVIKIDADNLPAVSFGNSEQARIGDWVLAFGNPLGFTFTVTSGIVSAKGRQLNGLQSEEARYSIQDFIQTDAAINPGNSGGPLVNLNGDVIGINSAIASQTGLYAGYGFAIPINLARRVMDDLISKGRVDRAILGINIQDAGPNDVAVVGMTQVRGILVARFPNDGPSPARQAGLELGDVIIAVNDTTVDHTAQLQQMVGFRRAGEVVRVTVMRRENGRTGVRRTFDVRLAAAEAPSEQAANTTRGTTDPNPMEGRLGVRVEALSPQDIQQARLTEAQQGVVVTDVEDGGPASQKLFSPEEGGPDIILAVNETRVRAPEDFKRALRLAPAGSVVQLRVLNMPRGGGPSTTRVVNIKSR